MSLLFQLFQHDKFRALFQNKTDVLELVASIFALLLSIELLFHFGLFSYTLSNIAVVGWRLGVVFGVLGIMQWVVWYRKLWSFRRYAAMLSTLAWIFFTVLLVLSPKETPFHGIPFSIGVIMNMWIYLRLGLLQKEL